MQGFRTSLRGSCPWASRGGTAYRYEGNHFAAGRAFGADDIDDPTLYGEHRPQILFFEWVTSTGHKWVTLGKRRQIPDSLPDSLCSFHSPSLVVFCARGPIPGSRCGAGDLSSVEPSGAGAGAGADDPLRRPALAPARCLRSYGRRRLFSLSEVRLWRARNHADDACRLRFEARQPAKSAGANRGPGAARRGSWQYLARLYCGIASAAGSASQRPFPPALRGTSGRLAGASLPPVAQGRVDDNDQGVDRQNGGRRPLDSGRRRLS
jgi:hypothetical protein